MENMRIVFLDLDGVMNSGWYMRDRKKLVVESMGEQYREIDPQAIETLNEFIEETGAKVVLSSSWRRRAYDEQILQKCGFEGEVIDVTPTLRGQSVLRGNKILQWIKDNTEMLGVKYYADFKQYVIFDDDGDMLLWQRNHFFQTDFVSGLTHNIAYRAKRFLLSTVNLERTGYNS